MKSFAYKKTIYFDQCDPAGILFFAELPKLAHQCIEDAIVESGLPWNQWFDHPEYAAPLVQATQKFFQPLKASKTYDFKTQVDKVGTSSITFLVEVFEDAISMATCQSVHVFIDKKNGKPRPLPQAILDKLT